MQVQQVNLCIYEQINFKRIGCLNAGIDQDGKYAKSLLPIQQPKEMYKRLDY